jgi:hypothetical protein
MALRMPIKRFDDQVAQIARKRPARASLPSASVSTRARSTDLGVSAGNGKGQIFARGEVVKIVPESRVVETLIDEALRLADERDT